MGYQPWTMDHALWTINPITINQQYNNQLRTEFGILIAVRQ